VPEDKRNYDAKEASGKKKTVPNKILEISACSVLAGLSEGNRKYPLSS
jgi:hypothetical protein